MMASYAASPQSVAAGKARSFSGPHSGFHHPALPLGFTKVPSRNTVIPITKPLLTRVNPRVNNIDEFQSVEFLVATSLTANPHQHAPAIFQYTLAFNIDSQGS